MKKINFLLTACLLVTTTIFLTGCDKEEPAPPADPDGTVIVYMRNGNDGAKQTAITPKNCHYPFYINNSDNFEGENWKFWISEEMDGLVNITEIPNNQVADWTDQVAVKQKYGYIGQCFNNDGSHTNVRIYVTNLIKNSATGGIIGAEVKYQSSFLQ